MEELSAGCSLSHMISYDDTDGDGRLNVNEFYMAFSKLYSKYHFANRSLFITQKFIFRKSMTKLNIYVNKTYSNRFKLIFFYLKQLYSKLNYSSVFEKNCLLYRCLIIL